MSENLSNLFPQEQTMQDYYLAAWRTYLAYSHPYDSVLPFVRAEYKRAVERLDSSNEEKRRADPEEGLAYHLMAFYWRGVLDLAPDGLVVEFFDKASASLRNYALRWLGSALTQAGGSLSEQTRDRLKDLWKWRVGVAVAVDNATQQAGELATFGGWFASAQLDDTWAISSLHEALQLTNGAIENDRKVVERLAALAAHSPESVADCLALMMRGIKERWQISGWGNALGKTLTGILESSDEKGRQKAVQIVNRLVAQGHTELRELLPAKP